jgi:hypothetical protein
MGIVNKRNAVVGWVALKVGKRVVKKKAQAVVPRERIRKLATGALAAVGGMLVFLRRKRDSGASGG